MSTCNGRGRRGGRALAEKRVEEGRYKRTGCRGTPALKHLGGSCRGTFMTSLWQVSPQPPSSWEHTRRCGISLMTGLTSPRLAHVETHLAGTHWTALRAYHMAPSSARSPVRNSLLHEELFSLLLLVSVDVHYDHREWTFWRIGKIWIVKKELWRTSLDSL